MKAKDLNDELYNGNIDPMTEGCLQETQILFGVEYAIFEQLKQINNNLERIADSIDTIPLF